MTARPAPTPHIPDAAADALPTSWQRLLALSGVAFAALFVVGWFTTGGLTPHWTGIVALIGAVCFLITFLTVLDGTTDGSPFGYAFFPAILSLVTWTVATSVARYRALATS